MTDEYDETYDAGAEADIAAAELRGSGGHLTADERTLGLMDPLTLRVQMYAASARYEAAVKARRGLEKALMLPPETKDGLLLGTARGFSLREEAQRVIDELATAEALIAAYSSEAASRPEFRP